MWLCTKLGFYSIVAKSANQIHIRARSKADLENLKKFLVSRVTAPDGWKIYRSEPADYRWRMVVGQVEFICMMTELAQDLDYSNFKGVIASKPDQQDKFGIYTAFHHDMERWQNSQ